MIYLNAFRPHRTVEIVWLTRCKDLTCRPHFEPAHPFGEGVVEGLRLRIPRDELIVSPRRRHFDIPRRSYHPDIVNYALSPGLAALLLTCRQIHEGTCSQFYSRVGFGFRSMNLLRKFLKPVRAVAKKTTKVSTHPIRNTRRFSLDRSRLPAKAPLPAI